MAPVWVSLPKLPLHCFLPEFLESVANSIGRFLCLDKATATLARPSAARMCVELDLRKPPPQFIWVGQSDGFKQPVVYEKLPIFCNQCHIRGHSTVHCSKYSSVQTITPSVRQNARVQPSVSAQVNIPPGSPASIPQLVAAPLLPSAPSSQHIATSAAPYPPAATHPSPAGASSHLQLHPSPSTPVGIVPSSDQQTLEADPHQPLILNAPPPLPPYKPPPHPAPAPATHPPTLSLLQPSSAEAPHPTLPPSAPPNTKTISSPSDLSSPSTSPLPDLVQVAWEGQNMLVAKGKWSLLLRALGAETSSPSSPSPPSDSESISIPPGFEHLAEGRKKKRVSKAKGKTALAHKALYRHLAASRSLSSSAKRSKSSSTSSASLPLAHQSDHMLASVLSNCGALDPFEGIYRLRELEAERAESNA